MVYLKHQRGFASDNNATVHPRVLEAIELVNRGHAVGYGDDPWTTEATGTISSLFGGEAEVFFVFTGTGANVISLAAALRPWESVLCAETAHIHKDECGAPERFTGSKVIPLPHRDGKLTPSLIGKELTGFGFEHHAQPKVISVSQTTERGTVYTSDELASLAELAHAHGMYLHVDGARLANAVAALQVTPEEMFTRAGVDILTFGGTKNGLMFGEAIVVLNKELARNMKYIRKQGMQLASKMRYIAAQFLAYLEDDLWLRNASHANAMAKELAQGIASFENIHLLHPVESNAIFARIDPGRIQELQREYFFHVFDEDLPAVRWMTSWDTTPEDLAGFLTALRKSF